MDSNPMVKNRNHSPSRRTVIFPKEALVMTGKAGDSMFSRDGKRVLWEIQEDVTKVFYGSKPCGY